MKRIIRYRFMLPDKTREVLTLALDARSLTLDIQVDPVDLPPWTRLDFETCPNCTLDRTLHEHCPLAVGLIPIVRGFAHILSYDDLVVEVITRERVITGETTAQRAISSFMGVVFATSGCPRTLFFRPMARFHLPLATQEETVYRACATYLLSQYFVAQQGREPDYSLAGLREVYREMQTVNLAVAERLRAADSSDSSVNALVMLDMFARAVPYVIEDALDELRYMFDPFLT